MGVFSWVLHEYLGEFVVCRYSKPVHFHGIINYVIKVKDYVRCKDGFLLLYIITI